MAKITFNYGGRSHDVEIPDDWIEEELDAFQSIPFEVREADVNVLIQMPMLHISFYAKKEMEEYLNYINSGGDAISFTKYIVLKNFRPNPFLNGKNHL